MHGGLKLEPEPCSFAGAADPASVVEAPGPATCGCMPRADVLIRSSSNGRFYATFDSGGQVYAIGVEGRMPFRRLVFELQPVPGEAPWFTLRHVASGGDVVVLPRVSREGRFLVLARPANRTGAPAPHGRFCLQRNGFLFSGATGSYVNHMGGVLLRGHGGRHRHAMRTEKSAHVEVFRATPAVLRADAARWVERTTLPAMRKTLGGGQEGARPVSTPRLHVLTYATKQTPMLCDALLVARAMRVSIAILGWGKEYHGNYMKLLETREHVGSLPAEATVLFADAFDVLYAAGQAEILARFSTMGVGPRQVLFQAARGCWPDWHMAFGRTFCLKKYPKSPTRYRYLNSGVWMGRAAAVYAMLTEAIAFTPGLDDQYVVSHMLLERPEEMVLDRHARLFQSLQLERRQLLQLLPPGAEAAVQNRHTGTQPLILHFNGGAKPLFGHVRDHLLRRRNVSREKAILHDSPTFC
jgi:hypothetical protein